MARRARDPNPKRSRRPPAKTLEGREDQLVSLAIDLAEKQLLEGTASAQVISHYIKLGSTREKLEQERLSHENQLTRAKISELESRKRVEELYSQALEAMRSYAGYDDMEIVDDQDRL